MTSCGVHNIKEIVMLMKEAENLVVSYICGTIFSVCSLHSCIGACIVLSLLHQVTVFSVSSYHVHFYILIQIKVFVVTISY